VCNSFVFNWSRIRSKFFPAFCVFTSRSLATASNSGVSSTSRAQVFSSQTPSENWLSSESESQSYFTTAGLPPIRLSWWQIPWVSRPAMFFQLNTCGHSPYVTPSPTRGLVCRLKLLLALFSVILRSESHATHDHILLSQIRDSPNLERQVPVFLSLRNSVAQSYPRALGSLSIASYDSQGYCGGIRPRLHTRIQNWLGFNLVPSL
jgi:hypothetical protein